MQYIQRNRAKHEQTAHPAKYPQGNFNPKPCRWCDEMFDPNAPSEHYCSEVCKNTGLQDRYLKRTYSIGVKDYEAMLVEQDYKCALCGGTGFTMGKIHKMLLVVDHCHSTGKVRGLLCHNCNRGLGLFHDRSDVLLKAIQYLKV